MGLDPQSRESVEWVRSRYGSGIMAVLRGLAIPFVGLVLAVQVQGNWTLLFSFGGAAVGAFSALVLFLGAILGAAVHKMDAAAKRRGP